MLCIEKAMSIVQLKEGAINILGEGVPKIGRPIAVVYTPFIFLIQRSIPPKRKIFSYYFDPTAPKIWIFFQHLPPNKAIF